MWSNIELMILFVLLNLCLSYSLLHHQHVTQILKVIESH